MILEQNEKEIQPIQTWVNGETKTMVLLRIDNYFGYDFMMNPGYAHYCLCTYREEQQTDYDDNTITVAIKPTIIDGNIQLPWTLIETWGSDDTPIFDYVAQQLNITFI